MQEPGREGPLRPPPDLRAVLLGVSAWAGALLVLTAATWAVVAAGTAAALALVLRRRRRRPTVTVLICLVAAAAVGGTSAVRVEAVRSGAVSALATEGAAVTVTGRVATDPVSRKGRFGRYTLTRLTVTDVVGRGVRTRTRVPVLVLGDGGWTHVPLGARVQVTGRLGPATGADLAGVLSTGRRPTVRHRPADLLRAAAVLRGGIRKAVASAPGQSRVLVPALVVGDDARLPPAVVDDFATTGLTHLAAVSGTNLTLVVGFLLLVSRWAGIRARGLLLVGALGVVGFVVLARPEPSVLRAAVMGSVSLVGMGSRGHDVGVRALGLAVFLLLVVDPWLALSLGFALSSLATAGILFLGPPFRDALGRWLPRWAAESLAVPLAAQLACTPLIAAISGQVSLVAVVANLAVAVVVGPATVLGLLGGVVVLVVPPLGLALGWLAGACAWWIIEVATRLARLPTAAIGWSVGAIPLGVLTVLCVTVALAAGPVLRRAWAVAVVALVLVVVVLRPLPTPGWPPRGWVLVACDVGQGDGLALNAGHGAVVVVDTGPDPEAMSRCLQRLGVRSVPVVVLTHFHADHVDGLRAVLADHRPAELDVTATRVPASGAREVQRWAAARAVPVRVPSYGEVRRVGDLTWQVIGPVPRPGAPVSGTGAAEVDTGAEEGGSASNDASLVLLVEVRGVRILMAGESGPEAQGALARSLPGLRADVLKVPHHGSRFQDADFLGSLGARLAVIPVGVDNGYGHPAPATLAMLRRDGMRVGRTDQQGDVAVTVQGGKPRLAHR